MRPQPDSRPALNACACAALLRPAPHRAPIARAQVESAPAVIKKGLKKEEAEALLAKLKESGGKAVMA